MEQNNNSEITLGLDLGVGSVGWTILKTSEENGQKTNEVLKTGVELFPEVTSAKKRREKRGARRLIRRRKLKLSKLRTMIMNCCDENNNNLFEYKSKEELENDLSSSGFIKINEAQKIYILDIIDEEMKNINKQYDSNFIQKLFFNSQDLSGFNKFLNEYKNNIQLLRLLFINLLLQKEFDINKPSTNTIYFRKIAIKLIYDLFKNRGVFYDIKISEKTENPTNIEVFPTFEKFKKDVLNSHVKIKWNLKLKDDKFKEVFSNIEWSRELEWILNKVFAENIFSDFKENIKSLFSFTRKYNEGPGSEKSYSTYGIYSKDGEKLYNNIWDKYIKKCSIYNTINGFEDLSVEVILSNNYKIFNTINNLQNILNPEARKLITPEMYEKLIIYLANIKKWDKSKANKEIELNIENLITILELKDKNLTKFDFFYNYLSETIRYDFIDESKLEDLDADDTTKLEKIIDKNTFKFPKFEYANILCKSLGFNFSNIDQLLWENKSEEESIFSYFTSLLCRNSDEESRRIQLEKYFEENIDKLPINKKLIKDNKKVNEAIAAVIALKPKYGNLSSKAINEFNNKILKRENNEEILTFSKYREEIIQSVQTKPDNIDIDVFFKTKNLNATTEKTLRIVDKLVSKLYKDYKFNNIVIEIARELNKSEKVIKQINNENNVLMEFNKFLLDKFKTNGNNLKKIKLLIEQNGIDLYTGQKILSSFENFDISKLANYEIDHIIPQSKFYDSRMANLALTNSTSNKKKSNKTAYDYVGNNKAIFKSWNVLYKIDEKKSNQTKNKNVDYKSFELFKSLIKDWKIKEETKAAKAKVLIQYFKNIRRKKIRNLLKSGYRIDNTFLRSNLTDTQTITKTACEWFKIKFHDKGIKIIPFKGFATSAVRTYSRLPFKDRNDNIHHAVDSTVISTTYNNSKIFKDLITVTEEKVLGKWKYYNKEKEEVAGAVQQVLLDEERKYKKEFENSVDFKYYPVIKFNKKTTQENIVAVYQQYQNDETKIIRDLRRSSDIKEIDLATLISFTIQTYHKWKNKENDDLDTPESLIKIYLDVVSKEKNKVNEKDKIYFKWIPIWVNDTKFLSQIKVIYDSLIYYLLNKCKNNHNVSNDCANLVDEYSRCISKHKKLINNSDIENKWFVFIPKKYLMKDTTEFIVIKKLTIFDYSQNRNTSSYINWIQKDENSKIGNLKEIDEIYYGILCIKNKNDNDWKPIILRYDFLKNVSERIELIKILSKIDTHITNDYILQKINNWITKNVEGFKKFNYIKEDEDIQITKETEVIYLLNKLTYIRKEEKSNSDKSVEQIENNNLFIIKKIGYTNIQVEFSPVREKKVHYKPILNTVLKDYKRWIK